jgi:multidrug efflux pump subunit AcrA (membrane-fusion protein)
LQQRQQLNVLDSQRMQAQATLKAQEAARDLAEINLGYTRITAPVEVRRSRLRLPHKENEHVDQDDSGFRHSHSQSATPLRRSAGPKICGYNTMQYDSSGNSGAALGTRAGPDHQRADVTTRVSGLDRHRAMTPRS